jgi:NAD(P)-dependent dehydrogenase (short-subunit alcohol dehydrogenase family)
LTPQGSSIQEKPTPYSHNGNPLHLQRAHRSSRSSSRIRAKHPRENRYTLSPFLSPLPSSPLTPSLVLITGVSPNGLGIATALAIASQHPRLLILAGRSLPNLHQAISSLSSSFPSVPTKALELDLASPDSIRAAASELLGWEDPAAQAIDVLINNAGVMSLDPSRVLTQAGLELHFATNHLGHFLFANLIMRKLLASAERGGGGTRVVNVASNAHLASPIRYHDVNLERAATELPEEERPILQWLKIFGVVGAEADGIEGAYDPFVAYAQSKTASVLFSVALAERMRGKGVRAFSLNPGGEIAFSLYK